METELETKETEWASMETEYETMDMQLSIMVTDLDIMRMKSMTIFSFKMRTSALYKEFYDVDIIRRDQLLTN